MGSGIDGNFELLHKVYGDFDVTLTKQPPTSTEEIQTFEREAGFNLPEGVIDFYLISNGSGKQYWGALGRNEPIRFAPFSKCVENVKLNWPCGTIEIAVPQSGRITKKAGTLKKVRWFPFAEFNGWTSAVICDLEPGPNGKPGQILIYRMPDEVEVAADSFGEFWENAINTLKQYSVLKYPY